MNETESPGTVRASLGHIQRMPATEAEVIADLAMTSATTEPLNPEQRLQHITVPQGAASEIIDLEKFLPAPERKSTTSLFHELEDLIRYTTRHRDETETTLWVDVVGASVCAVINDHSAESPAWRDHRATHKLRATEQWKHWIEKSGKLLTQSDFAEHIEDGALSIIDPDPATMLEIAQTFHAKTGVEFKQIQRIRDGQLNVQYAEETAASAGTRGDLDVPQEITLLLPVFEGQEKVEVQARIRYRLREGQLSIGYKLVDVDEVLKAAIDLVVDRLVEAFDRDVVFLGVA